MAKGINEVRLGVLVGQKNFRALRDALSEMNDVDVAQFIEDLPEDQQSLIFRTLAKEQEMGVFAELEPDTQQHIIESISDREIASLMEELAVDDAVDMLEEMPAMLVKRVLRNAPADSRDLINQFLRFPEDSAGSIMTAEFTDLRLGMTVGDAIKRIRRIGEDRETVYTCYVIDDTRHLLGVVTVKDLLLAHDTTMVSEIMELDLISVTTTEKREKAAALLTKYGLMALPVVDGENRLVGIVTVDDAADVLQEETTEDFEKMAAMQPSERPYLRSGIFSLARNRMFWLLFLMISATLTGIILQRYELAFAAVPLLVTFIPMLTDTGGNVGSQSSTLVIRCIALGEIGIRDWARVFWKELQVSLLVGIPLALVNLARVVFLTPADVKIGIVVSLAMICTVVLANTIGGMLPMLAKIVRIDPAIMAAPLIATIVDVLSLIIYFTFATLLLGL